MSTYHLNFSDRRLRDLHSRLLHSPGIQNRQLDCSISSIQYTQGQRHTVTRPDRVIQSTELFRLITERPALHNLYRRYARESLPWVPNQTRQSQSALREFDQMLQAWRSHHPRQRGASVALARQIFSWLRDPNGFGFVIDAQAPERTFNGIVRHRRGDCTESTFALMVFLRRAGFTVRPLWVGVDHRGDSVVHVATQIQIGNRQIVLDPVYQQFGIQHRSTTPMQARELLAWYWNNRALSARATRPNLAAAWFDRAMAIDSHNPHIRINRADYWQGRGQSSRAAQEIQAAIGIDAQFSPAHERLGNWAFDRSNYVAAVGHYQRALQGDARNHEARENLIRSLVQIGRGSVARRQLERLRRLDPQNTSLSQLGGLVRALPAD